MDKRYQLSAAVDRELYIELRKLLIADEIKFKHWLEVACRAYIHSRPLTPKRWKREAGLAKEHRRGEAKT